MIAVSGFAWDSRRNPQSRPASRFVKIPCERASCFSSTCSFYRRSATEMISCQEPKAHFSDAAIDVAICGLGCATALSSMVRPLPAQTVLSKLAFEQVLTGVWGIRMPASQP